MRSDSMRNGAGPDDRLTLADLWGVIRVTRLQTVGASSRAGENSMRARARLRPLWNREDASELERPTQPNKYGITVASRDWTVETIVRQVEQENIDLDPAFQRRNAWRDHRRSRLIESFILGFPVC
jgi:hypothetical protein